jgi:glycerophosphoryl diester phosphodiesterase
MWKLVAADTEAGMIIASDFAALIKASGLKVITWTLDRTADPLEKSTTDYYWQTLQSLDLTPGSRFELLDVLSKSVGIEGIFDDWPAVSSFYANCMGIKLR